MKIAVAGGGLQGLETAYLADKAGWQVTLVDRKPAPPAKGLCHRFLQVDLAADNKAAMEIFKQADVVFPALENQAALDALVRQTREAQVPLAFDARAYAVSRSKSASNRLFEQLGLPLPAGIGDQTGAVIVKPSQGSGSSQVHRFDTGERAQTFLAARPPGESWVCQQFLPGPTFSVEVLGRPGNYRTYAVTDLFMDDVYDCKRVRSPSTLSPAYQKQLADMALRLAEALNLTGLMDVEVVLNRDHLHLLEIDARIPSQTPTAVYWSSGTNMIEQLGRLFAGENLPGQSRTLNDAAVIYEHVHVSAKRVETHGEHMMTQTGPLRRVTGFFGCDEAITDFSPDAPEWSATLICGGRDHVQAWRRRSEVMDRIRGAAACDADSMLMGGRG